MAKFATNARCAMLLLNLIQVTESISGSAVPLAMFFKVEPTCGLTVKDRFDFSIDPGQLGLVHR